MTKKDGERLELPSIKQPEMFEYSYQEIISDTDRFEVTEIVPKYFSSMKLKPDQIQPKEDTENMPTIYVQKLLFPINGRANIVWNNPGDDVKAMTNLRKDLLDKYGVKDVPEGGLFGVKLPEMPSIGSGAISLSSVNTKLYEFGQSVKEGIQKLFNRNNS